MGSKIYTENYTQNRELSWLRFNERVLDEADDESVPLIERSKFISIFISNLDEFFMIRVGSLFDLKSVDEKAIDNKTGMTPDQQLKKIYKTVSKLYIKQENIYFNLEKQLRLHGVYSLNYDELEPSEEKYIKTYFKTTIQPILSPQIVDIHHPFPHLLNKAIYVGAMLKAEDKDKEVFGLIPVPNSLPDVIFLPGKDIRFIRTENVIKAFAHKVFDMYTIKEKTCFCVTRNSDINTDDEGFEVDLDFRNKMKKLLGQRRKMAVVRLEMTDAISDVFQDYLCEKFNIQKHQIYIVKAPLKMKYAFSLESKLNDTLKKTLTYKPFTPCQTSDLIEGESILRQVQKKDLLLSYPFESMDPFLQMLKEASTDPYVISIKITIYRLASKAKIVQYLCEAAENGKDVTVLIELRARFDEQNNIDWSERLEEAGCKIIYGFEGYKVHSKICLITRREKNDVKYITQVGTGNYNENTAKMYTDLSLITSNEKIGKDAMEFFKNMGVGNLEGKYNDLWIAPISLKQSILDSIDDEIKKGEDGRIVIKINSITDIDIIKKLSEASCAGVHIELVVRGICCILPGIEGKTENISVTSIVGRYLEHSRIYIFGKGEQEKMYISSADFMTRNTERRVEIACPIYDYKVRAKINHIMDVIRSDNTKARIMLSDGFYVRKNNSAIPINSQEMFMEEALKQVKTPKKTRNKFSKTVIEKLIYHLEQIKNKMS